MFDFTGSGDIKKVQFVTVDGNNHPEYPPVNANVTVNLGTYYSIATIRLVEK